MRSLSAATRGEPPLSAIREKAHSNEDPVQPEINFKNIIFNYLINKTGEFRGSPVVDFSPPLHEAWV